MAGIIKSSDYKLKIWKDRFINKAYTEFGLDFLKVIESPIRMKRNILG